MQKLIIGNLKMNMENVSQRDNYCSELVEEFKDLKTENLITICPPSIYLEHFVRVCKDLPIEVGAQDCFWELYGSYTGNTSPKTIKSVGANFAIVGHSERRNYNHETNEDVARKVATCLRVGISPIICIGYIYDGGEEMDNVREQVEIIVNNFTTDDMSEIVFAYEPIWAIGSGKTPTSDDIHSMIMLIRSIVATRHGKEVAESVVILYGGSVVAENVVEVCKKSYADGVLVGRASLSPKNFVRIVHMLKN